MHLNFKKDTRHKLIWRVYTVTRIFQKTEYNFSKVTYLSIKKRLSKILPEATFSFSYIVNESWGSMNIEFASEADEAHFILLSSNDGLKII
jgi:hypothetical protein